MYLLRFPGAYDYSGEIKERTMTDKTIIEEQVRGMVWKTIVKHCRCCDWSKHAYDDELADWLLEQLTLAERRGEAKARNKIINDLYPMMKSIDGTTEDEEEQVYGWNNAIEAIQDSLKQSPDQCMCCCHGDHFIEWGKGDACEITSCQHCKPSPDEICKGHHKSIDLEKIQKAAEEMNDI